MDPLSDSEIARRLARVPGWDRQGPTIRRTFSFPDFGAAMAFVNRVADLAEARDHHPDMDIRYSKVTLTLTTHDAGGLTERDFDLAARVGT
jgi:4a-hydroxytetrahydrobiopterin dehydratase